MDLNVLHGFIKMGVGSFLLDTEEKEAAIRSEILALALAYMQAKMVAMDQLKSFI